MNDNSLAKQIKDANRAVYNKMSPEAYNQNESIFNNTRKVACTNILEKAADISGKENYLDIATGTGNLLRLAYDIFENCYAVDIGDKLLLQIKQDFPGVDLVAADAEYLPFKTEIFNCISCYAMLHHLLSHEKLFKECFFVLKKGGTLYTDHDPNYFLNRFYHLYYKVRYSKRPGFGSDLEELAEYHNAYSSGINPLELKKILLGIGFSNVIIKYRFTDRTNWQGWMAIAGPFLKILSDLIPVKSFFTHFSIIAIK